MGVARLVRGLRSITPDFPCLSSAIQQHCFSQLLDTNVMEPMRKEVDKGSAIQFETSSRWVVTEAVSQKS